MLSGLMSAITGASNVGFTPDMESLHKPGSRCVMSEPIEDLTAEQLKQNFWTWVEKKEPFSTYVTHTNITGEKATGLVEEIQFEVSGLMSLLVSVKGTFYAKYRIDGNTMFVQQFGPDKELKEVQQENRLTILENPLRVEGVFEDFGCRKSGPLLKGFLESDLKSLEYEGAAENDVDSPSEPGKKSVVCKTVKAVDFAEFWEKLKALRISEGFEEAPDGSLRKDTGGLFGGSNFTAVRCDSGKKCVVKEECGPDGSYKNVMSTVYTRVDGGVFESWAIPKANVDVSQTTADSTAKMINSMIDLGSS
eukprot:TRINITY_DN93883_c0_g1_i1.p1 TRINITY_DN93883_c0_g1~~TRINITY_DN93883_c0_g1_i1.p1  ORF type:complete len:306 (-),score=69.88 TRINITY_DN93883_c0_g1_i1:216-1133(-)